MTQGIYAIRHIESGFCYIGSSYRIESRFQDHRRMLRKASHHAKHLQHSWNKYGAAAFSFEIIEVVSERSDLFAREQFYIDASMAAVYNGSLQAAQPEPRRGVPLKQETKLKLSAALKGRVFSEEVRAKISAKATGRRMTDADKAKMSAAKKGKKIANMRRPVTDKQISTFRQNTLALFNDNDRREAWLKRNKESHAGVPWSAARRQAYERNRSEAGL